MYLIHVIPITRGAAKGELSYFTSEALAEGALVSVPLRNRLVPGLVTSCERVAEAKTRIRTASFKIKKIEVRGTRPFLTPALMRACRRAAEHQATTVGAILYSITPNAILEDPRLVPEAPQMRESGAGAEMFVYQGGVDQRTLQYKNLVREQFAQKRSVFLLAPTIIDAQRLYAALSRGIEPYALLVHSGLSKKETQRRFQAALETAHPVLVIATPGFLACPRADMGMLIIEREQAPSYKQQARPFLDVRRFAEFYAQEASLHLVRADLPLSVESIYRLRSGDCDELDPVATRIAATAQSELIDMRGRKTSSPREPFEVVGTELTQALRDAHTTGAHAVLFAARRGISPITLCGDCGETVVCRSCGAPVVLHKGARENVFVCHACGAMRSAHERCAQCAGWRLTALGIGARLVEQKVREKFPEAPVMLLDHDAAPTHRAAKRVMETFYEQPGAILVGTEMALPYLERSVELAGIVSIDSLLSVGEWNVYERILSIMLRLRERARERFIVQTRKPDQDILSFGLSGDLGTFYKNEIDDRKRFQYPPFAILIKLSCEGSRAQAMQDMQRAESLLEPYGFMSVPHVFKNRHGRHVLHGFVRLPAAQWPKPELVAQLRSLPPSVAVDVEPQGVL